jgi:hypothetical protein
VSSRLSLRPFGAPGWAPVKPRGANRTRADLMLPAPAHGVHNTPMITPGVAPR